MLSQNRQAGSECLAFDEMEVSVPVTYVEAGKDWSLGLSEVLTFA